MIKLGGDLVSDPAVRRRLAVALVALQRAGTRVAVVHGGGSAIDQMLHRLGIASTKRKGQRRTSDQVLEVTRMVLSGTVNSELVGEIYLSGGAALGLGCGDAGTVTAIPYGGDLDLGAVGRVGAVNRVLFDRIWKAGLLPVLAPVANDDHGRTFNINADLFAAGLACGLRARSLILLSDVEGILTQSDELLETLSVDDGLPAFIEAGMVPKVEAAAVAARAGVDEVVIASGARESVGADLVRGTGLSGTRIVAGGV